MGSEASRMAEHGWVAASPTVPELISDLRTSFSAVDFENATKILVDREESMKKMYIVLCKEAETFKTEKDLLSLENQKLNDELKKKQKEFDALRKENLEFKDQNTALKYEKSRVSVNLKQEDELKKKQREIDEMRKINSEFEKKLAELTFYKKQSKDLHDRVLRLEKTAEKLMTSGETSSFNLESKQQKSCAAEISKSCEKGNNKKRTESNSQEIIEIADDDDEEEDDDRKFISTLKRKRCSDEIKREYDSGFVDKIKTGTQRILSNPHSTPRSEKPTQLEPRNLITSLNTCDPITDPNIKKVDEKYKSLFAKLKPIKKGNWGSKADMLGEIEKDDKLCMNAICALYRQSRPVIAFYDKPRITELALLLTNGDPQQKVTKKVSELTPSDFDDCRSFVRSYQAPLFNICQKKTDPFFPPLRN